MVTLTVLSGDATLALFTTGAGSETDKYCTIISQIRNKIVYDMGTVCQKQTIPNTVSV